VLDAVRRRWPGQPLATLGFSMGGAALCFAGAHVGQVNAIILESVYHDLASAFARRLGTGYPAWIERLNHGTICITERRLGLKLHQVSPVDHIGSLPPAPTLLMTGEADPHAPPEDAERLRARCPGTSELWLIPDAGHHDTVEAGGVPYQRRVLEFLDR